MTLTAPGSAQADSSAGGPIPPCPARGLVCRNCGATFELIAEHACASASARWRSTTTPRS